MGLPTRRAVLLGLATGPAAALVACSATGPGPDPSPDASTDADNAIRVRTAASETDLVRLYDATIAAHPSLAARLAPLRTQHAEHLVFIGPYTEPTPQSRDASASGVPSSSPSVAPSSSPSDVPSSGAVPPTPAAALRALVQAERSAAATRVDDCVAASNGDLADMLARIGGSEAQHAAALAAGAS